MYCRICLVLTVLLSQVKVAQPSIVLMIAMVLPPLLYNRQLPASVIQTEAPDPFSRYSNDRSNAATFNYRYPELSPFVDKRI